MVVSRPAVEFLQRNGHVFVSRTPRKFAFAAAVELKEYKIIYNNVIPLTTICTLYIIYILWSRRV